MSEPRLMIVSPALACANNGNWHTAARWRDFLRPLADVEIALQWHGEPVDALIALHARRSADSIARFAAASPKRPLALVLTGTDLYRDIDVDAAARHSMECATRLVVLQSEGLRRLTPTERAKARVIVQSAERIDRDDAARSRCRFAAVGHLRDEKDPATLMRAVRRLAAGCAIEVVHVGSALDAALGEMAQTTMAQCPLYRWLGGLPQPEARGWIARSDALVHASRIEGGANVVIEAVRSGVAVLASRIDGNVGLLGRDYEGYFPLGDDAALAALMQRFAADASFAHTLRAQCAAREPLFSPAVEAASVRSLATELLGEARLPR